MKIKSFILTLLITLCLATPALAINIEGGYLGNAAKKAGYSSATDKTLAETVGVVIKAALSMVGAIFLILMVYAGYLWMTARGEEEQVKKAQKIISTSIIGLVIVVSAYGVTTFIMLTILARTASGGV